MATIAINCFCPSRPLFVSLLAVVLSLIPACSKPPAAAGGSSTAASTNPVNHVFQDTWKVVAAGGGSVTAPTNPDFDAIQGTWKVQRIERDGSSMDSPPDLRMTFKGDNVALASGDTRLSVSHFTLDATKTPHVIVIFEATAGQQTASSPKYGIYELSRTTLKMSIADRELGHDSPPKDFEEKFATISTMSR